jgi:hypothetical protein
VIRLSVALKRAAADEEAARDWKWIARVEPTMSTSTLRLNVEPD